MLSGSRQDILASIVVFLVALPLCMGIAIASGAPVATGLITGIIGGLVVGFLSGAPLQVSGPAAGLTVIVYQIINDLGLETLGITVLVAGCLQLVAGALGYGRWFRAVSPAVVSGMLAGIGVLILTSQAHVMVDDSPKGSGLDNLLSMPTAIHKGLPIPEIHSLKQRTIETNFLRAFGALHDQQVQLREIASQLVPEQTQSSEAFSPYTTLHLSLLAARQDALQMDLVRLIEAIRHTTIIASATDSDGLSEALEQAPLATATAIERLKSGNPVAIRNTQLEVQQSIERILSELMNHDWAAKVGLLTILLIVLFKVVPIKKLRHVPSPLFAVVVVTTLTTIYKIPVLYVEVPQNLWSQVHFPSWAVITSTPWTLILGSGIVLAIVASAETLLCANAVDQMQSHSRTNYNRELASQGIGNMLCGLLGALPMTGVIIRSSANVNAGAKTRWATILHGLLLLVFASFLAFILRLIPTASLAAILVYTGYKLIDLQSIKKLREHGWGEVIIYFATLGTIVCADLLTGVITGIVLSAMKLLHTFSHLSVGLKINKDVQKAHLELCGAATFLRLPLLAEELERVPHNYELHVDFQKLHHIDHACLDLLMTWARQHEKTGGTLVIDWETLHAGLNRHPEVAR